MRIEVVHTTPKMSEGISRSAPFDGAHIISAELADEIAQLKNNVLTRPRLLWTSLRSADVVGRQDNDCEIDIGMVLEFLDDRAPLVRLLVKYHWYEIDLPQEAGDCLSGLALMAVNNKHLAGESFCFCLRNHRACRSFLVSNLSFEGLHSLL